MVGCPCKLQVNGLGLQTGLDSTWRTSGIFCISQLSLSCQELLSTSTVICSNGFLQRTPNEGCNAELHDDR